VTTSAFFSVSRGINTLCREAARSIGIEPRSSIRVFCRP
jgi:hypothetical protein